MDALLINLMFLQFRSSGDAYLYDLGSTHGTFINKNQVKKRIFVDLHVGDVIRFGHSSRLYVFQGPNHLMLPDRFCTTISLSIQETICPKF